MIVTIHPAAISGKINAPASKSCMQRACALALLHHGETTLINPGKSNDDQAALHMIQKLGAEVQPGENGSLLIKSSGIISPGHNTMLNCHESGLGIRMFTPVAALSEKEISITGTGSLLKRPMHFFDEVFPALGVSIHSDKGYLPIKIKGPLRPGDIVIDGSLSSQFLTGLLIAFAKAAVKPVTIRVNHLNSKPYIDLTLNMLHAFHYQVENENYEQFHIKPAITPPGQMATHNTLSYTVEGDWSGAAFLLVAGAIAGGITVSGLDVFSSQADKAILQPLMDCGAPLSIESGQITVGSTVKPNSLKAFHFNATDCPDLFPPLVALAAYCSGKSVIEGVHRLEHKESNRARTLKQEFAKMGVTITVQDDLMIIDGGNPVKGARVFSHHDHRIAMACAVAGLQADSKTSIKEADAVHKSYPHFFEDLKLLHADVSLPVNN